LYYDERRSPFFPDLREEYPEQAVLVTKLGPRSVLCEDRQLLPQSGIFQCDLFVASKNKNDKSQYA